MSHPISPVSKAAFSVESSKVDDTLQVVVAGNGDMEAAPVLGRHLSALHGQAQQQNVKAVRLDLTRLYFLNSSCLKSFASLVALDSKLAPTEQYKIIFRLGLPWQRRTIAALQSLGRGFVIVEDCTTTAEESA